MSKGKIGILFHPDCALHEMGENHPESPQRLQVIETALKHSELNPCLNFIKANTADFEKVTRAHDKQYLDNLINIAPKFGYTKIDEDTMMNPWTLKAALFAAGSVIQAVDLVMEQVITQAFCNVRPPGHHALHNKAMGFCFLNNVAIGVLHALTEYSLKRVAIIDFDVHHGNGTEDIIKDKTQVLFCSSYQYPFYPQSPIIQNNPHILHLPLQAFTDSKTFREGVSKQWLGPLREFAPDFIFISAGFDAHYSDPIGGLKLTEDDYYWITKEVFSIAKECCNGRVVSSLEGGYNLSHLGSCVVSHLKGLLA